MTDREWEYLLESIDEERCILCIGPGLYTEGTRDRLENRIAEYLRKEADFLGIRVYDDGWFHYLPHANEIDAWQHIKSFYSKESPELIAILELISQLPFHFILNFIPDYHLRDTFECQEFTFDFMAYQKSEPYDPTQLANKRSPTKTRPLVYNILGEYSKRNSLVMTYNDFYAYLESIFEGKSIAPVLKENIWAADYFIFLGMPFDRWYVHMFMRILQQHERNRRSKKYAANVYLDDKTTTISEEQYTMTFIASDIKDFISELHSKCQLRSKLRTREESVRVRLRYEELQTWAMRNEFREAFEHLTKELDQVSRDEGELLLQVQNLTGRYDNLLTGRISGTWDERDINLEQNRIRMALLELIQLVKQKFA